MNDDDLRDRLTAALLDTREWRTSAEGGWAADLTDVLMPVVREALGDAWDDGWGIGYRSDDYDAPDNPWRQDD